MFTKLLVLFLATGCCEAATQEQLITGTLVTELERSYITIDTLPSVSVLELFGSCNTTSDAAYLTVTLTDKDTNSEILSSNFICDSGDTVQLISDPNEFKDEEYALLLSGLVGTEYNLTLRITEIDIDQSPSALLSNGLMVIRSFNISDEELITDKLAYAKIAVESANVTLPDYPEERNVAKMIVTKTFSVLKYYYETQQYSASEPYTVQMLSFSSFGAVTLSNVSYPTLAAGVWYIGVVQTPQPSNIPYHDKEVVLSKQVVVDYGYNARIILLLVVSLTGVIFPIISRIVFDYNNFKHTNKIRFKVWLGILRDWIWRGDKGYPYLMTLLAVVLSVGAYQVVNAKWLDMIQYGDRDICYYNEHCYRPHGSYDVSVNDCASNLPFIVHGVILLLYFSLCEAYCESVGHTFYDYSIPYAFGVTLICEGFGSLLYHICPSQIIFQFDTMFMFMISILQIIGIFAGYSARKHDVIYRYNIEKAQKVLQPNKVICFFVAPVYFFNFIGNLSATQGLPTELNVVFYVGFSVWLLCILLWAAYNLHLLSCIPILHKPNLVNPDDGMILESIFTPTTLTKIQHKTRVYFKKVLFGIYCLIAISGAPIAFLQYISFSIYILGILTIAVLGLTFLSFIPLMHRLVVWVRDNHNGSISCGELKFWGTNQIVIALVMIGYVTIGCVFSAVSLIFFTTYDATDKAADPWLSREMNSACLVDDFYSAHDIWHLGASFSLMIMILINVQIGKPCRDCYLSYLSKDQQQMVRKITWKLSNSGGAPLGSKTLQRIFKNKTTTVDLITED